MKIIFSLLSVFLVSVLMISCGKDNSADNGKNNSVPEFETITMEEAMSRMKNEKDFILLDVRREEEFSEGHIPGAVLLSNEKISPEKTDSILKDREQQVYVYCRSGRRSRNAAEKLAAYGYKKVTNIGGILDYKGPQEK